MLLQEPVSTIPLSPRQCWLSWHINTAPEGKVGGGGGTENVTFWQAIFLCPKSFDQGCSLQALYKADTLECAL